MAGTVIKSTKRGRYTAAGYVHEVDDEERTLYIERDQAGTPRDLMRDNNRIGYAGDGLDDDGLPFSFFDDDARREEERAKEKRSRSQNAREEEMMTFTERLARAVRRERRAVVICCVLMMLNLTLLSFWGQMMIDGVKTRNTITMYENGSKAYQMEIDNATMQIANASNGERVRNKAQNELGMLRSERVASEKIYIQTSNLSSAHAVQEMPQEEAGLLDWLLSVADIFDFHS